MDELFAPKKNQRVKNPSICNLEMLKLQQTLSKKRKQRKKTQIQKNTMTNKLNRLKDEEKVVVKQIQNKYNLLQNIYKVRLRKHTQENAKQRNNLRRQLKEKKSTDRRKEVVMRRNSVDQCFEQNKKAMSLQNTISFKGLHQLYNQQLSNQRKIQNYQKIYKQQRRQITIKFKNEYVDEYKFKLKQQQTKKKKNLQKIKRLSRNQSRRKVEIQGKEISKIKLQNLIKRAHSVSLVQLQSEIKRYPSQNMKRTSYSRLQQSKMKLSKRRLVKVQTVPDKQKSVINGQETETTIHNKMLNKSVSDIQKTIKMIQQLQSEQIKKAF